jgi:hypothetical protein
MWEQCWESLCVAVFILTGENAVSFLLLLISTLQWNWRKVQNRFCLEVRGVERVEAGVRGGNDPNNVFSCE